MPIVPHPLPSAERLNEIFLYDPETGLLSRRSNPSRQAGTVVGGYWTVKAGCQKIRKAHRIIWKMMTGKDPVNLIDHVNGVGTDNRWANLREADNSSNQANRRKSKGDFLKGARRVSNCRGWQASITANRKTYYLGYFDTEREAHEAYLLAAEGHFGEYARVA
jgi:hypothetical protein